MFTGIIEAISPVHNITHSGDKIHVQIKRPDAFSTIKTGDSIACNGICLTITSFDAISFTVEIMNETKRKTNALDWSIGTLLNLERALMLGARLDGHWVQGHVDCTMALSETSMKKGTPYFYFRFLPEHRALLVAQGSIAINGVSLTLAELSEQRFAVALIGHTLGLTNLSKLKTGNKVNIEFDILGKYIQRLHAKSSSNLTEEWLNEQGF